jgi:hypothetical protein
MANGQNRLESKNDLREYPLRSPFSALSEMTNASMISHDTLSFLPPLRPKLLPPMRSMALRRAQPGQRRRSCACACRPPESLAAQSPQTPQCMRLPNTSVNGLLSCLRQAGNPPSQLMNISNAFPTRRSDPMVGGAQGLPLMKCRPAGGVINPLGILWYHSVFDIDASRAFRFAGIQPWLSGVPAAVTHGRAKGASTSE